MVSIQEKHPPVQRPIRTIQFGEGNFLRAFIGDLWQHANNCGIPLGNIAVVKPRIPCDNEDPLAPYRRQGGVYTVLYRGKIEGRTVEEAHIIDCVSEFLYPDRDRERVRTIFRSPELRYVVSNTTEAGITLCPEQDDAESLAVSFPAKLTQLLYDRYTAFAGDRMRGLTILPMELIEENGSVLRECILTMAEQWRMPDGFTDWVRSSCVFVNTLADRIVTGKPAAPVLDMLGYRDEAVTVCEPFFSLVLASPLDLPSLVPLQNAGQHAVLSVTLTKDLQLYRARKVRILNGAHTGTVLSGILAGISIVRDLVRHPVCGSFLKQMLTKEILPYVPVDPLDPDGAARFAAAVYDRFDNPYIDHRLLDISIESVEKWRVRILPSLRDYYTANGKLPVCLTFSYAALLAFLTGEKQNNAIVGKRPDGTEYPIQDTHAEMFLSICRLPEKEYVCHAAGYTEIWQENLTDYPGFTDMVSEMLCDIRRSTIEAIRKWGERA